MSASPPLNPAQREAVEHFTGPMLVLAGAGSGKTRVITQRVARLLERGISAKGIVALTFTNKAAAEMRERIAKTVGSPQVAKDLTISTFHSFGLSVLTRERKNLGSGGAFTIFDQGDQLGCVKEILSRIDYGKRFDASVIASRISNAKNAFQAPEELPEREGDDYDAITRIVYPRYQTALKSFQAYDFDDLVCEVARLWQSRPDVLARWQEKSPFLLVDEYQDTNRAQLEVLRLLAGERKNLCVVGDDDQAIYGWRGADVRNILDFDEHFVGAKVVKLEQNYRSVKPVLDVANAVIARRQDAKHRKTLFTDRLGGDKVRACVATSPEAEAQWVAMEIRKAVHDDHFALKEVAVLYRSNGQAKAIEEALREQMVPHRVVGGQQFFERKEVKDLLAYLKLALNRSDEISLRRIMNYPPRGIGDASIEKLAQTALARGWTLWQAVERVDGIDAVSGPARDGCKALESVIAETRKHLLVERMKPSEAAKSLCERIALRKELDATSPSPAAAARRWANVDGMFGVFARREAREAQKGADPNDGFGSFLHALTLDFGDDEKEDPNLVTLSTLHGSKGLEFDVVFLVGCEEGLLPHSRTLDPRATDVVPTAGDLVSADIEEERRLFYVGVTRAKKRLTMSRAKARVVRGKPVSRTPSRFLLEVPPELVDESEVNPEKAMTTSQLAENASALLAALEALG
ncbi:MAG TPA: UvrD-helicase domain-containing protein [Polyangiaceae bacterium]